MLFHVSISTLIRFYSKNSPLLFFKHLQISYRYEVLQVENCVYHFSYVKADPKITKHNFVTQKKDI